MEIKVKNKEKLIKFLIHNIQGFSFGTAQKAIRLGKIKINGKKIKDNIELNPNDIVDIYTNYKSVPKIDILYEDDNILIVNKPEGLECATRDKSSENTYSLEEIFKDKNAIVVHRLDRLTEGLVILAKNKDIAKKFETYFRLKKIDKFYYACVRNTPTNEGVNLAYLKKDSKNSKVIISDIPKEDYKEIITEFKIVEKYHNFSLVDIKLHTGRTHQIRAYFAHIGNYVLNDNKYGNKDLPFETKYKGYFLTAYKLKFNLDDELKYLNNLSISITPSWINDIKKSV